MADRRAGIARPAGRLDTRLSQLLGAYGAKGIAGARTHAKRHGLKLRRDGAEAVVEAAPRRRGQAARAVRAIGGTVISSYEDLLLCAVPIGRLERLSKADGIVRVSAPIPPVPTVISEGVSEINATAWHSSGLNGSGVKIGIIDGGFEGYPSLLGGELPSNVTVWGSGSAGSENGGGVHGTAVAEIVHDVAPNASLYLARVGNVVDLGNAKNWMKSKGVQVVNMSLAFPSSGLLDGQGPTNEIVDDAVSSGIFWANSAGNHRNRHWAGDYISKIWGDGKDANNWMNRGGDLNTFVAYAATTIQGHMWWKDSWGSASQDYDLTLWWYDTIYNYPARWIQVAQSRNRQNGGSGAYPLETITYMAPWDGYYAWRIERYSAAQTNVDFDLVNMNHNLDDDANPFFHCWDHSRSILVPADNDSNGFMSTAALGRAPSFLQEYYSSQGPTRDGRTAPEISAPSDVTNYVFDTVYDDTFPGTSSSSPHLAGAAALVKQVYPGYTPANVETYLKSNAVDLGTAGPDNVYGNGRLRLPSPPSPNRAPGNVSISPVSGSSAVGEWKTFAPTYSDPDGSSDLADCQLLIAKGGTTRTNSALVRFSKANNRYYLRNDSDTAWLEGVPGSTTILENSQVRLDCQPVALGSTGPQVTLSFRVAFKSPYAGSAYDTYLYCQDSGGLSDGWDRMGTWAVTASGGGGTPGSPLPDTVDPGTWVTDGVVCAIWPSPEGHVYIGGDFDLVHPPGDPSSGYARSNIARLLPDGSADPSWNPGANGIVYTLGQTGPAVVAGGNFTSIGGAARNRLASVWTSSGSATTWNPNANAAVRAMTMHNNVMYFGGDFTTVGGQSRLRLAALKAYSGELLSWNPGADGTVRALACSAGSVVDAGGDFTHLGGQPRNRLASIWMSSGAVTSWNPNVNDSVYTIATSASRAYVGGDFSTVGGQPRTRTACFDVSGSLLSWNPGASGRVKTLALSGSTLFAGGGFSTIGGKNRNMLAALDAETGNVSEWLPHPAGGVEVIAPAGSVCYVGGIFTNVNDESRRSLASFGRVRTSLTCGRSALTVPYGGTVTISGLLTDVGGAQLGDRRTVQLFKSNNYVAAAPTYYCIGDAAYDSSTGRHGATPPGLTSNTAFHLRFTGDGGYQATTSPNVVVLAQARMYMPVMGTYAPRRYRIFTVAGCFRPGHTGKTRIEFYRKVGSSYRIYRAYYATNAKLSSALTKYTLRTRLPYRGYWRLRARHLDSGHAKSYSSWRYFRVR